MRATSDEQCPHHQVDFPLKTPGYVMDPKTMNKYPTQRAGAETIPTFQLLPS